VELGTERSNRSLISLAKLKLGSFSKFLCASGGGQVSLSLTERGMEHVDEVVSLVFQYLKVRASGAMSCIMKIGVAWVTPPLMVSLDASDSLTTASNGLDLVATWADAGTGLMDGDLRLLLDRGCSCCGRTRWTGVFFAAAFDVDDDVDADAWWQLLRSNPVDRTLFEEMAGMSNIKFLFKEKDNAVDFASSGELSRKWVHSLASEYTTRLSETGFGRVAWFRVDR
jgi:hypothetical protein